MAMGDKDINFSDDTDDNLLPITGIVKFGGVFIAWCLTKFSYDTEFLQVLKLSSERTVKTVDAPISATGKSDDQTNFAQQAAKHVVQKHSSS